jgi:hypothetical protein
MAIKKQTVIPANFKITKCPPAEANATPLWKLRQEEEKALSLGFASRSEMLAQSELSAENRAERRNEAFGMARANGASVSDALDDSNF